jgi:hypothetical protein
MTKSGLRGHSSANAIFTQSTGVPLHDHTSTPSDLRRNFIVKGVVAEKAHANPLLALSGAQTMMSPNSRTHSIRQLMPLS